MIEYNGLGKQFEEMGKSFQGIQDNIPHIIIGNDKPVQQNNSYVRCPYCNNTLQVNLPARPVQQQMPNNRYAPKPEKYTIWDHIKTISIVEWGMFIGVSCVITYAIYRLFLA